MISTTIHDERAVRDLADRLVEAEIAADVAVIESVMADDVVVMPPFVAAIEGKAACLEFMQEVFRVNSEEIDRLSLSYECAEICVSGDLAFERGRFTHLFAFKETGEPTEELGQYLRVYARAAGIWRLARVIWNRLDVDIDDDGEEEEDES